MSKFFFVPYFLNLLSQGLFFRRIFFYFFRVAAVLTATVGLVACAGLLKTVLNFPAVGVVGGFIFIALLIVAFYAASHIYWIRAASIRDLSDAKFTMIPIYAIMVRTMGEVLAAFVSVVSLGGFILFLFAPLEAGSVLSGFLPMGPLSELLGRGSNSFVLAIGVLVIGALYAVALLAIFYLVAEAIMAIAEIAISSGKTAVNTSLLCAGATPHTTPILSGPLQSTAAVNARICGICGTANPVSAVFCENCGKPL